MVRALLLDLDDTLLINDMEVFAPYYFQAVATKVKHLCPPSPFLEALRTATRAMLRNDGRRGTNADVFYREFLPRLGRLLGSAFRPEEVLALFDDFYAHDFEALRAYTAVDADARLLVKTAQDGGFRLAVVTQPIFPRAAIEARLRWAEVGDDEFHYDLITSFEVMGACKPHPAFFSTVFERLSCAPRECLMVGDSPEADMVAGRYGCRTFWVDRGRTPAAGRGWGDAQGQLRDVVTLIETGRIHEL